MARSFFSSVDRMLRRTAQVGYRVRRWVDPDTRSALLEYDTSTRRRETAWSLNAPDRQSWVLNELRAAVRHAAETPFWRRRFESSGFDWNAPFSFADYATLPVLERHDVASHGEDMLHPAVPRSALRKMATGGSSGVPTVTWTGPRERGWGESAIEQFERRIGVLPTDRRVFFWGHNLDPVARTTARERIEDWIWDRTWLDCFRLSKDVLGNYHARLQRAGADVVVCYASALVSLAQFVDSLPRMHLRYPRKAFITGAEKLYSHERNLVKRVFGCAIHERYGGRDLGMVAFQTSERTTALEVDWANVYAEPEMATESSSLLITKLHADAMPMLRYRSGDIIRRPRDHEYPGPLFALDEVLGRDLQQIWMPDGTWMHAIAVPHLMKDFNVSGYQLHQRADLSVELLLCPRDGFSPAEGTEIVRQLAQNLPRLPIEVRYVSEIPRTPSGKVLPVISDATPARARTSAVAASIGSES